MGRLRVLDLFSGIGGFSLGLERTGGFETVAFCEIDPFCRKVLAKHWPGVPIHEDVRMLSADAVGPVDLICGGYPCQPFSTAGKRRGEADDRHLWPEMYRLVAAFRPAWVCGENVAGHINMGLDQVLSDLESEDYACQSLVVPACAVDAPHRRERLWILAHDARLLPGRQEQRPERERAGAGSQSKPWTVAHAHEQRCETSGPEGINRVGNTGAESTDHRQETPCPGSPLAIAGQPGLPAPEQEDLCRARGREEGGATTECCRWPSEPAVGRVAHGVPQRVDRLRALGNAVVPQIPEIIGRAILEAA